LHRDEIGCCATRWEALTPLAARIDRLGDDEKQVLQTASVIGKEFSGALLSAVVALLFYRLAIKDVRQKTTALCAVPRRTRSPARDRGVGQRTAARV
jgi:hypothetical protein